MMPTSIVRGGQVTRRENEAKGFPPKRLPWFCKRGEQVIDRSARTPRVVLAVASHDSMELDF